MIRRHLAESLYRGHPHFGAARPRPFEVGKHGRLRTSKERSVFYSVSLARVLAALRLRPADTRSQSAIAMAADAAPTSAVHHGSFPLPSTVAQTCANRVTAAA